MVHTSLVSRSLFIFALSDKMMQGSPCMGLSTFTNKNGCFKMKYDKNTSQIIDIVTFKLTVYIVLMFFSRC